MLYHRDNCDYLFIYVDSTEEFGRQVKPLGKSGSDMLVTTVTHLMRLGHFSSLDAACGWVLHLRIGDSLREVRGMRKHGRPRLTNTRQSQGRNELGSGRVPEGFHHKLTLCLTFNLTQLAHQKSKHSSTMSLA